MRPRVDLAPNDPLERTGVDILKIEEDIISPRAEGLVDGARVKDICAAVADKNGVLDSHDVGVLVVEVVDDPDCTALPPLRN
jgi:hypothetical protein